MERDEAQTERDNAVKDFNSHAHVERDEKINDIEDPQTISTHTLTWSVTKTSPVSISKKVISTHTLTWSVTPSGGYKAFKL